MTQTLFMEPAWERTLSEKDRTMIVKTFRRLQNQNGIDLMGTYLRHAYNHRGRLLYTVLLHNYRDHAYSFKDKKVTLIDISGHAISDTFTLPVEIPSNSTMPWTFIFPVPENTAIDVDNATLLL